MVAFENVPRHRVKTSVSLRPTKDGIVRDFPPLSVLLTIQLVFIAGNGGATPRHATLFASDVPPSRVVRLIDRYLMYYIQTAVCSDLLFAQCST